MYPLADATNSQSFNGFHRAFIPDVLKDHIEKAEQHSAQVQDANKD